MALVTARATELIQRIHREVDEGTTPSCQIAVGLEGELVLHESAGAATIDTRYNIFSCTKALIAATIWQMIAEGSIAPEDRIVDHFPEFGDNGKDAITVEQVMTHTSGFPRAPIGPPNWGDRAWRIERMASWRLNWEPGTRFEYHPTTAHWVLAELIERVDGVDYRVAVRDRVLDPLGLERFELGVAPENQGDIATLVAVGEQPTADEVKAVLGIENFEIGEVTPEILLEFNKPEVRAVGVPGGGGISTAADVAMLYQGLLHNTGDLWDPAVLADGTEHVRCTLPDPMLGVPASRTLGLTSAGTDGRSAFRGMGHNVSSRTFGHAGAAGQIAWADPETGISFCYLTCGIDRNFFREARRIMAIASRAGLLTSSDVGAD